MIEANNLQNVLYQNITIQNTHTKSKNSRLINHMVARKEYIMNRLAIIALLLSILISTDWM